MSTGRLCGRLYTATRLDERPPRPFMSFNGSGKVASDAGTVVGREIGGSDRVFEWWVHFTRSDRQRSTQSRSLKHTAGTVIR